MSNRKNHRRGENRRTENGPRWENANPGKGCNSTHVAKSRKRWKELARRKARRLLRRQDEQELETEQG